MRYFKNLTWYILADKDGFYHSKTDRSLQLRIIGFSVLTGKIIFRVNNYGLFYRSKYNAKEIF
jgi:hypothetical protein